MVCSHAPDRCPNAPNQRSLTIGAISENRAPKMRLSWKSTDLGMLIEYSLISASFLAKNQPNRSDQSQGMAFSLGKLQFWLNFGLKAPWKRHLSEIQSTPTDWFSFLKHGMYPKDWCSPWYEINGALKATIRHKHWSDCSTIFAPSQALIAVKLLTAWKLWGHWWHHLFWWKK